LTDCFFRV